jgi:ketol-acid reductoisomerase
MTGKSVKDSFGVIKQEDLAQQPLEPGGTRNGRLGFTFHKMVAQDLFGEKGLRFRITAEDVYGKQMEASLTRN